MSDTTDHGDIFSAQDAALQRGQRDGEQGEVSNRPEDSLPDVTGEAIPTGNRPTDETPGRKKVRIFPFDTHR